MDYGLWCAYMYVHVYNEPNRVDFLSILIIVNVLFLMFDD